MNEKHNSPRYAEYTLKEKQPNCLIEDTRQLVKQVEKQKAKNPSLYKSQSQAVAKQELQRVMGFHVLGFVHALERGQADLHNPEEVAGGILRYFNACIENEIIPTVEGMAVIGLGMASDTLNRYEDTHNNQTTDILKSARQMISAVVTNQGYTRNIDVTMGIFQLKNNRLGYSDRQEVTITPPRDRELESVNDIAARYEAEFEDVT